MKLLLFAGLFIFTSWLYAAAPLDGGFALAPKVSASQEEKDRIFNDARSRVINAAVKYENTPYRFGGIDSNGLDCSGFISVSFMDALGVSTPRSAASIYSWTEKITLDKAQPGDLLFFRTGNTARITHVALYLGGGRFIHAASSGPSTGVIYSNIDEQYWERTYAGAGRVFPESSSAVQTVIPGGSSSGNRADISVNRRVQSGFSPVIHEKKTRIIAGAAFAPTWNGFLKGGNMARGFTSQFRLGADTSIFNYKMILGFELRPEYDGALGVFRLPLTFSWGRNDKLRIFAGPVLSIGHASLSTDEGERSYSGGTTWFGAFGVTLAPFIFNTSRGEIAPYFETAWQSYSSDNSNFNFNADFSANIRFSTGIRWTMQVN